jgi:hypothetical protein
MGALPAESKTLATFIVRLLFEIVLELEAARLSDFSTTIRQGLAISLGPNYASSLGGVGHASDSSWAGESPEHKFQPPASSQKDSDYQSPRELFEELDEVISNGKLCGTGIELRDVIGKVQGKTGGPPIVFASKYGEYLSRYTSLMACRF